MAGCASSSELSEVFRRLNSLELEQQQLKHVANLMFLSSGEIDKITFGDKY